MKKMLLWVLTAVLLSGCAPPPEQPAPEQAAEPEPQPVQTAEYDTEAEDQAAAVDGTLEDGMRVIALAPDFDSVHVYRGETVQLILRADGALFLSAPDFDVASEGSGEVSVEFKAVTVGTFDIVAAIDGEEKTGRLVVEAYAQQGTYHSVDAAGFAAAMTGDYLLLDVRSKSEYDRGHIEGALLIPHTELAQRLDEVAGYDKILVYCASGNRSVAASQILIEAGVKEVYDLAGGFSGWQEYQDSISVPPWPCLF